MHSPQYAVGLDLGGTSIKAGLIEYGKGLVAETTAITPIKEGPEAILDALASLVITLSENLPPDSLRGVGIGAPGSISLDRTSISYPPNLPGWTVINVREALLKRLGNENLCIAVENDANVAGLGSYYYGSGQHFKSFLMVTLGTGVGGAIVVNGKIFRGAGGGAGEIGHMTVDYEGPIANSGVSGAIEAYLGQRFLSSHARQRLRNYPNSILYKMLGESLQGLEPKHLSVAAYEGDSGARDVLAWAGHKLGCVLGSAVNLLDIRKIVVGGGVAAAGDFLLVSTRDTLWRYVTPGLRHGLEVVAETLGNEAGMLGAAHLAFDLAASRDSLLAT